MSTMPPTHWENFIERKAASPRLEERSSIFLGVNPESELPVCMPRSVFQDGHCHVQGKTSAGKSTATLLSLIWQLLRGYELGTDAETGLKSWSEPHPIIILDLKGDIALFHAVRDLAKRYGQNFRFLSTRQGDDYHFFDPFQLLHNRFSPLVLATQFVRAFSLDYGLIYGGQYFTAENTRILQDAVKLMAEDMQDMGIQPSILRLSSHLTNLSNLRQNEDARHIQSCLQFLAEYPQVDIAFHHTPPKDQINMATVLEEYEVVYFFLELLQETIPLRQIAGLAMYSVLEAANVRRRAGDPLRQTYVFVDEFYHIAGPHFGEFMSAVREWGIHLMLANQFPDQLDTHQAGLSKVISKNSSMKQWYTVEDPLEAEYLKFASGTRPRPHLSESSSESVSHSSDGVRTNNSTSQNIAWHDEPWLQDNEIHAVNDTKLRSHVLIDSGRKQAPGRRVRTIQALYPIPYDLYIRYHNTRFPEAPEIQAPARKRSQDTQAADAPKPDTATATEASNEPKAHSEQAATERDEKMRSKFHELADEEKWN